MGGESARAVPRQAVGGGGKRRGFERGGRSRLLHLGVAGVDRPSLDPLVRPAARDGTRAAGTAQRFRPPTRAIDSPRRAEGAGGRRCAEARQPVRGSAGPGGTHRELTLDPS